MEYTNLIDLNNSKNETIFTLNYGKFEVYTLSDGYFTTYFLEENKISKPKII